MANQYSDARQPEADYLYKLAQIQKLMYGSNGSGSEPFNYFDRYLEKQAEQAPFVTNAPAMQNPFGEFTNTLGQLANNAILEGQRKEVEQKYNNTSKLVSDYRITMSNALASGANQAVLDQVSNAFIQELGNNPDKYMAGIAYQSLDPTEYFKRFTAKQQEKLAQIQAASGLLGKPSNDAQDNKNNAEADTKQLEALSKMGFHTLLAENIGAKNNNDLLNATINVFMKALQDNLTDSAGNFNHHAVITEGDTYKTALTAASDTARNYIANKLGELNKEGGLNNNVYSYIMSRINATENNELDGFLRNQANIRVKSYRDAVEKIGDTKYADDGLLNMRRDRIDKANAKFEQDNGLIFANSAENPRVKEFMGEKIAKLSNRALDKGPSNASSADYLNLWYNTKVQFAEAASDNAIKFHTAIKNLERLDEKGQNISIRSFINDILGEEVGDAKATLLENLFKNMGIFNGKQLKYYLDRAAEVGNTDPYVAIGMLLDRSFTMDWTRGSDDIEEKDLEEFYQKTASIKGEDYSFGTSDLMSSIYDIGGPEKSDKGAFDITKEARWYAPTASQSYSSWLSLRDNRKNTADLKRTYDAAAEDAKYNELVRKAANNRNENADENISKVFGTWHEKAIEDEKKKKKKAAAAK